MPLNFHGSAGCWASNRATNNCVFGNRRSWWLPRWKRRGLLSALLGESYGALRQQRLCVPRRTHHDRRGDTLFAQGYGILYRLWFKVYVCVALIREKKWKKKSGCRICIMTRRSTFARGAERGKEERKKEKSWIHSHEIIGIFFPFSSSKKKRNALLLLFSVHFYDCIIIDCFTKRNVGHFLPFNLFVLLPPPPLPPQSTSLTVRVIRPT